VAAPIPLEPPVRTATRTRDSLASRHNGCVERRERERILGQWGGSRVDDDPREQALGDAVARDLEGSPLVGRPQRYRPRNFRPTAESYIASLGGPLPYMRRLRQIAEETAEHERQLAEARADLAAQAPDDFRRRWQALARRWRFDAVNELIERHNRFYPAEARLPMDPRTRDYALVNGRPYWIEPLGPAWILERFPLELERASAAA
jgi:hypothetical protein